MASCGLCDNTDVVYLLIKERRLIRETLSKLGRVNVIDITVYRWLMGWGSWA